MGQNFSSEPVVDKETERAESDTFNVAVSSCQGWRMTQEDNHSLMLELPQSEHKASFFAVYDGHGSARISKYASESLWRHLTSNSCYKQGNFKEALEQAFLSFDKEVNESLNAQLAGTTAICVLIVDNVVYCANIGDSRAVASINCVCEPLSQDHKPDNPEELKRIITAGGYVFGNRVNGNLALSRAFGDFHYKGNVNLGPEDQIVSPCPDIKRIELNDDVDFLVLACDGIWDVLTSEEVVDFVISRLEHCIEPGLICEQLTTRCMATDYELVIGCDNMTVLLVCHTRGRSWEDYCTDIFNKNSKKLGVARTRSFDPADLEDDTDVHWRRQKQLLQPRQQQTQEEGDGEVYSQSGIGTGVGFSGDAAGRMNRSDEFGSHIPRDIRMLLDAIQNLHHDDGPNFAPSEDASSRINRLSSNQDQDSAASSEAELTTNSSEQDLSTDNKTDANEQPSSSSTSSDTRVNSEIYEVHLAPDDDVKASDDKQQQEDGQVVTKTVEVDLSESENVLDEAPDPIDEAGQDGENKKDQNDDLNPAGDNDAVEGGSDGAGEDAPEYCTSSTEDGS